MKDGVIVSSGVHVQVTMRPEYYMCESVLNVLNWCREIRSDGGNRLNVAAITALTRFRLLNTDRR
jgi:hypothetical protein